MGIFDFFLNKKEEPHNIGATKKNNENSLSSQRNEKARNYELGADPRGKLPDIIGKHYSMYQIHSLSSELQLIDTGFFKDELLCIFVSTAAQLSPKIRRFMSGLDLSTPEKAAKFFMYNCVRTEMGYGFGYAIIENSSRAVLGLIFVRTPSLNEITIKIPHWTIEYCLFENFEKQGIMTNAMAKVLSFLKSEIGLSDIYAYADMDNVDSLRLLSRLYFDERPEYNLTNPETGNKAKMFCCNLATINFVGR